MSVPKQLTEVSILRIGHPHPGEAVFPQQLQEVVRVAAIRLLPPHAQLRLVEGTNWSPDRPVSLREALQEPERQIILAALEATGWNRQKTSDLLEINRTTLYKKIKQHGLEAYGQAS